MSARPARVAAGRAGHAVQQQVQLGFERGERPAGQQHRRGVEFQVEPVQLERDPLIGRRGLDGLVARQRPGRAVNQEQLGLGAHGDRTSPEAGLFQQLPERGQAFLEPVPEARVVGLAELLFLYPCSHDGISSWGRWPTPRIRRPVRTAGRTRT